MIIIDKMNENDIPRVTELLNACYSWLSEIENFPPEFTRFLISRRGSIETIRRESAFQTYLVARVNYKISGMVAIEDNKITKLYVLPERHRQGIGRKLFEVAEKIITGKGFRKLSLVAVGKSPIPFYRAMGMHIIEVKRSKIPAYMGRTTALMEKALSP
jgi:ribosomal protein S18 acetylase RimI-like enzyme